MIISHKHKFIFVKTHKTASTSIEMALSSICGEKDIITPISPLDEKQRSGIGLRGAQNLYVSLWNYTLKEIWEALLHRKRKKFHKHMSAQQIKASVSKNVWNSYFKFTIERNPFDRMVSLYFWREGDKKFDTVYEYMTSDQFNRFQSFEKYAINDAVAVDKVYQYEYLDAFLEDLSKRLDLEEKLRLPLYRAKSHTRKVKDYRAVLDEKSVELIKQLYAKEIELFNYKY